MKSTRAIAGDVLLAVLNGQSLSAVLKQKLILLSDTRDKAFVQAVTFGVCRYYFQLKNILSQLVKKPLKAADLDIEILILIGLFQLIYMRTKPHAAVTETVNACPKQWARGLVNGVLRHYLRQQKEIDAKAKEAIQVKYNHPEWWIASIQRDWPEQWETILVENNQHAPLSLRVNATKISRDAYLSKLNDSQMTAVPIPATKMGVKLETPQSVEQLPGYREGEFSVQDAAPQLAAELLQLTSGLRVLDACAAPGGKLTHCLEIAPQLAALIGIDKDPSRLQRIQENLSRLNRQERVQLICESAEETDRWWDGQLFDRILLDAPCSATGVVRRHPDIKLLRKESDIAALAKEQLTLLNALWPLLKKEGLLLYATCSVFKAENCDVIEAFLSQHPDAKHIPINASWGKSLPLGRQIFPGEQSMDGFYYALLSK